MYGEDILLAIPSSNVELTKLSLSLPLHGGGGGPAAVEGLAGDSTDRL